MQNATYVKAANPRIVGETKSNKRRGSSSAFRVEFAFLISLKHLMDDKSKSMTGNIWTKEIQERNKRVREEIGPLTPRSTPWITYQSCQYQQTNQ